MSEEDLLRLDELLLRNFEQTKALRACNPAKEGASWRAERDGIEVRIGGDSIFSEKKSTQVFQSFRQAILGLGVEGGVFREFIATVSSGPYRQEVALRHTPFEKFISVKTSHPSEIDWIDVHAWAEKLQQPYYINFWAKWWPLPFFMGAVLPAAITFLAMWIDQFNTRFMFQKESEKLLAEGLSDKNRDQAIELLLRISADVPKTFTPLLDGNAKLLVMLICYSLAIVAFFPPRSALGVGKGKSSISKQRSWWNILLKYVFPVLLTGKAVAFIRNWLFP